MSIKSPYALTGVIAAALAFAAPALAQTAPADPASPDRDQATALGDVVVTARRREENLQDVPLSVTAYSSEALSERRIADRADLANFTPSLLSITGGYPKEFAFFALRGQGPAFGAPPGVVNYFAEVPNVISIDGRTGSYFDLASVQVALETERRTRPRSTLFADIGLALTFAGRFGGVRAAVTLRTVLGELGMPSIPSILAIPSIGKSLSDEGAANEPWIDRSAGRFLDEFAWYAEALAAKRAGGQVPY